MKSGDNRSHSSHSSETAALQKLGFGNQSDIQRTFASILNRMRPSSFILSVVTQIFSFIQILAMGFYCTIHGIFDESKYTTILKVLFRGALNIASVSGNEETTNIYLLIVYLILLVLWMVFYVIYIAKYRISKTFTPLVINLIYYLGYHVFNLIQVVVSTTAGSFMMQLVGNDGSVNAVWSFLAIALLFAYYVVSYFMTRIVQSSPDVDIKNRLCYWPQNFIPAVYRMSVGYGLPLFLELFRGIGGSWEIVGLCLTMACGIGGVVVTWYQDSNVFPVGRVLVSTEYHILIAAPLMNIILRYAGGNSLWYLLAFVIVILGLVFLLIYVTSRITKVKIDLLYSKFENLTSNINTPAECIALIKIGIIFNAPCITNHTLLNWAISRWPNNQPLLFMVAFIFYVIHMPYREILDLVSVAVDIAPFTVYDGMLFSQIFNRLPTREQQLARRLEGIKRLYDLPRSSLRAFWEAVLTHQWDEAIHKCNAFRRDLDHINQIFSNLIFENPSSDCVMQEFIKFAMEIQGNYAVAYAAQREIQQRSTTEENPDQGEGESIAQMSKLSSVKSSIFLSEFSENGEGFDKVQNGIQSAIIARPIFWPARFLLCTSIIVLVSLTGLIVVYVIARSESQRVDNQVELASKVHQMSHYLTQMLCCSLEFTAHDQPPGQTVSGTQFDYDLMRNQVNAFSTSFDQVLAESFDLHSSLPEEYLRLWTDKEVDTILLSPDVPKPETLSLMGAIRIYQMRTRTLSFSSNAYLGSIENPCPEILAITYLYPSVSDVTQIMVEGITEAVASERGGHRQTILIAICVTLGVNFLIVAVSCPIIIWGMHKEYEFFMTVFGSVPTRIVKKVLNREHEIVREEEGDDQEQIRFNAQKKSLPPKTYRAWEIAIIMIVVFLITPIPVFVSFSSAVNHANDCKFVLNGLYLSCKMINSFGLLFLHSFRLITGFRSPHTIEEEIAAFDEAKELLVHSYNEIYFGGTDFYPNGLVEEYSSVNEKNVICKELVGGGAIDHRCTSFHDDVFYIYMQSVRAMQMKNAAGKGVNTDWWRLFYPVASTSLDLGIDNFFAMFTNLAQNQRTTNNRSNAISLAVGVTICIVAWILCACYVKFSLTPGMKCLLKPIMVMDPDYISDSPFLMRFLQGDFDNATRKTSRESRRKNNDTSTPLIDFILEGVVVMNSDGSIIASNRKYHEMMANTAEEVLGINVRTVFPPSLTPLFEALEKIKAGGICDQNLTVETSLFTEDDKEIPVRVTLVAQLDRGEHGNKSTTCAFLISDRSEILRAQYQLRKEKQNVESLLDTILPHPIAASLISGKTEISFEVEKAVLLCADIVSFTPMSTNMKAKQIMNVLNRLITEFDTELSKFKRITKLKTVADSYFCASGIFEDDGTPEEAASEMISFAQRIQEIVPMLNRNNNMSMHFRIGVHIGGPVICGVLGKEKPLFEIIGQPMSIVEELEATCAHDCIHISQAVADTIVDLGLKLAERGDGVKVPGLENQKTWTIGKQYL